MIRAGPCSPCVRTSRTRGFFPCGRCPGEFHEFFAGQAGTWQVTGKMWMAPDAEPIPSESIGTAEMILGGRYLKEEMKGTSMGMPFEGLKILGSDNITGVVTVTWYDNMGTMTTIMSALVIVERR